MVTGKENSTGEKRLTHNHVTVLVLREPLRADVIRRPRQPRNKQLPAPPLHANDPVVVGTSFEIHAGVAVESPQVLPIHVGQPATETDEAIEMLRLVLLTF